MDSIVQRANRCADVWWPYVAGTTWQASVVAGVLVLVTATARRMPARRRSGLILVAFIKFAIPPVVPAPLGYIDACVSGDAPLIVQFDVEESATPAARSSSPPVSKDSGTGEVGFLTRHDDGFEQRGAPSGDSVAQPVATRTSRASANTVISWTAVGMCLWLAGSILLLALLVHLDPQVRGATRQAELVAAGALYERFRVLASELGVRHGVRLRSTEKVVPPRAVGIVRPAVVVPVLLLQTLGTDEFHGVLAHDLAHQHRRESTASLAISGQVISDSLRGAPYLANTARRRRDPLARSRSSACLRVRVTVSAGRPR